jgi:hypothetical protein
MIVTETYLKNAEQLKNIVKNSFSLSGTSYKEFVSYVDNPMLVLNDKTKSLIEKYGDKVIDYRIPLDIDKILKSETPPEAYLALEMLNDILFQEYPKYRSLNNECNISIDLLKENKFIMFKQERKLWRFLKSMSFQMATHILKEENGEITIDEKVPHFCIGPMTYSANSYKNSLGTRTTSLRSKINKYEEKISHPIKDVNELSRTINLLIDIISDIFGAKNISNPDGYEAYLSFNFFDWFLASTGESWGSCIGLESDMCYGLGLTGLFACPDWGMVMVSKKTNKIYYGIEVPHIVTRSWAIHGDNDKYNLVNWYPHDIRGRVSADKSFYNGDLVLSFNDWKAQEDTIKASTWYKPFYMTDNTVPFIYADCYDIKISKSKSKVRIDINGNSSGMPSLERFTADGEDKFLYGGNLDDICESLRSADYDLSSLIANSKDAIEASENSGAYYCDHCGNRTRESTTYVNGIGEVCEDCMYDNPDFYFCEDCEEWYYEHRDISGCTASGRTVCENCLNRNYTQCENCEEWYENGEMMDVEDIKICEHCFNDMIKKNEIEECESCGGYFETENMVTVGNEKTSVRACLDCIETHNYCSTHGRFYSKEIGGCPYCEKENSEKEEKIS